MSEEESQSSPGDHLFSVQGPDSSLGWGRVESPPQGDRTSGSARPCEGPGAGAGGRGAERPPDLAGRGGQRALLGCRGGAKSQAWQTQAKGNWDRVGLGQICSGPQMEMGVFRWEWEPMMPRAFLTWLGGAS